VFALVLDVFLDQALARLRRRIERRLGLAPRPVGTVLVVGVEFDRGAVHILAESRVERPVILRDEVLDLPLPIDDQGKARTLHAAHREVVPTELVRCDREEAREDRAPGEVHGLAGLGRPCERTIDLYEIRERALDIPLRQGGEAGPAHPDFGPDFEDQPEGFDPDQLAFAVEVRGDDDLVRVRA